MKPWRFSHPGAAIAMAAAFMAAVWSVFGVRVSGYGLFPSGASGAFGQEPEPSSSSEPSRSTAVIWTELLQKTPYPHTAALPDRVRTALDGTYCKFDPKTTPPVPCRRCPDYLPEGGIWKLSFDKGVFRIFHDVTGWRSLGSFIVDGDRVQLFNDPCCIDMKGVYRWNLAEGRLILRVIEDKCAIGLRARNLTQLPWLSGEKPQGPK